MKIRYAVPGCLALASIALADDVDVARQWVETLPDSGIYTDGYAPHEPPSPMTAAGQARMVPVAVLEYYRRAWQVFLERGEHDSAARDPRHYKIGHSIENGTLVVVVQGLLLPRIENGAPNGIIRASLGPSMRLRYDLESGELTGMERLR